MSNTRLRSEETKWCNSYCTFQCSFGVRLLILYTLSSTFGRSTSENRVFLFARCVSLSSFCCLTLALSTWGVLYRRPLGFGPTAKPIRLECVGHRRLRILAEEGRDFRCDWLFALKFQLSSLLRNRAGNWLQHCVMSFCSFMVKNQIFHWIGIK